MTTSPLRTLVSRHVCGCSVSRTANRPLSKTFITTTVRRGNYAGPASPAFASAEDLKRKYQPKREKNDRYTIEEKELKKRSKNASYGLLASTVAVFGAVYFWPGQTKTIKNDSPVLPGVPGVAGTNAVTDVELVATGTSSVPHFPKTIYVAEQEAGGVGIIGQGNQEYSLVGLGIRTVSFLSIQVYVLGMYVAVPDIATLQERLIRTQDPVATTLVPGEKGKLKEALLAADTSEDIWNEVLKDGNIRSIFRIVPVKNTDFGHLRDGFVRQLTAKVQQFSSRRNDQSFSDEKFGESVQKFKQLFSQAPKNKLPTGEILLLTRNAQGVLEAFYEDKDGARTKFGQIDDERISRLMWLQYLSGKNPSSESARQSIVEGVMNFVARPVGTVATQVV